MIGYLKGKLVHKEPQQVLLDVGGVGYLAHIPLSTYYLLGEPGTAAELFIHTHVREDALALFGFASVPERQAFERLIGIGGIGPKLANNILSGISPQALAAAVGEGNLRPLTGIPGVGKKTAERILLELKDKLADLATPEAASAGKREAGGLADDVVSALVNLGYKRAQAEEACEQARGEPGAATALPAASFDALLREALRRLSR